MKLHCSYIFLALTHTYSESSLSLQELEAAVKKSHKDSTLWIIYTLTTHLHKLDMALTEPMHCNKPIFLAIILIVQLQKRYLKSITAKQLNTLRLRQNGHYFPEDIYKCILFNKNVRILIKISLQFVSKDPINNIGSDNGLRWPGNKPSSEPTRITRTPAFWGYPPPPHDYPHYWVILDPKSKK